VVGHLQRRVGAAPTVGAQGCHAQGLQRAHQSGRRLGWVGLVVEAHVRDDGKVWRRGANRLDRHQQLSQSGERLEDEEVDAALGERRRLLLEYPLGGGALDGSNRLDRPPQRSHAGGHQDAPAGVVAGLGRYPGRCQVDLAHPPFEVEVGQPEAVGPEAVGLDDVGAGRDVVAVDSQHERRLQEIDLF
jgi:hypothetical protein